MKRWSLPLHSICHLSPNLQDPLLIQQQSSSLQTPQMPPTPAASPSKKHIKSSLQSSGPPPSLQFEPSDIPDLTIKSHGPGDVFDSADQGGVETGWRSNGDRSKTEEPGKKAVSASNSGTKAPVLKQQKMTSLWRKATEEEKNKHNHHTFQHLREETEFQEAEMAWAAYRCKERLKEQNKESQQ